MAVYGSEETDATPRQIYDSLLAWCDQLSMTEQAARMRATGPPPPQGATAIPAGPRTRSTAPPRPVRGPRRSKNLGTDDLGRSKARSMLDGRAGRYDRNRPRRVQRLLEYAPA